MSAISLWSTDAAAGERTSIFAGVRPTYLVIGIIGWGAFAYRLFTTFTL